MSNDLVSYRQRPTTDGCALDLQVNYRRVAELKLNLRSPRKHPPKQIAQIAASIQTFGFIVPVLVDQNGQVIAGHGRIDACMQLGLTRVPTICVEHLTQTQIKAFGIADDRLTENAVWDDQLLGKALLDLSLSNLNFDLEVTGFETAEIDLLIEGLELACDSEEDEQAPLPPADPPVTETGDLWALGSHRLYCGNALERLAFATVMSGHRAAMVITDPPYNVRIGGNVGGLGAIQHREFQMASGEMTRAEFIEFLRASFALCAEFSDDGSLHFIFMDWRHQIEILTAGEAVYTELKNVCVWDKGVGGMGSLYRSQHELVYLFKVGTAAHRNNVQLGLYGRNRTNVWKYPGANSFARNGHEGNLLALHPTTKPVALIADALLDASARGDIVLDPFLGSGTSVVAAEHVGRRCFGIEIDPCYVDVAIRRWQRLTGQKARHTVTGEFFDERTEVLGVCHDR
jgi:DNA modification methylase